MQKSGNVGCSIDSKPRKAKPPDSQQTLELEVFKAWSLVGSIDSECLCEALIAQKRCAKAANDPKLSDRGVRRGTCMAGGKAAAEAGAVTHGAVRCSAWLGVAIIWEKP